MQRAEKLKLVFDALDGAVPKELVEIIYDFSDKPSDGTKLSWIINDFMGTIDFRDYLSTPGLKFRIIRGESSYINSKFEVRVSLGSQASFKQIYFDDMMPFGRANVLITELTPDFPKKYDVELVNAYNSFMAAAYARY